MSRSEASAADVWNWLQACEDCGKAHEYRLIDECTGPPDHNPKQSQRWSQRWSWADPVDGHSYRRRLRHDTWGNVDRLRAAFEATQ